MKPEEQAAGLLLLSGDKQGTSSLATRLPERRGEQVEKLGGGHWNRPRSVSHRQAWVTGTAQRSFLKFTECSLHPRYHGSTGT